VKSRFKYFSPTDKEGLLIVKMTFWETIIYFLTDNTYISSMHIFLIGYMGSGKSYWANKLAAYYGIPFIDIDDEITKQEALSISKIFNTKGEAYFRKLEHTILQQIISTKEKKIIACGGGTPCFYNNMNNMKSAGITIWLNMPKNILLQRLQLEQAKRPLLQDIDDIKVFIEKQLQKREMYYKQADIIINNANISIEEFVKIIQHV